METEVSISSLVNLVGRCPNLKSLCLNRAMSLERLPGLLSRAPHLVEFGTGSYSVEVCSDVFSKLVGAFSSCKQGTEKPLWVLGHSSCLPSSCLSHLLQADLFEPQLCVIAEFRAFQANQSISKFAAIVAQLPGTTQDHLQIFNIETKTKVKSHQMPEQVMFYEMPINLTLRMNNWLFQLLFCAELSFFLSACTIGANFFAFAVDCLLEVDFSDKAWAGYSETSVYHWSIEGDSQPMKMFERTANLASNQIINYRADQAEKWLVLIGLAPGSPEQLNADWRYLQRIKSDLYIGCSREDSRTPTRINLLSCLKV